MSGPIDKPIRDQPRPLANGPVLFDRQTANRTAASTTYVERIKRGGLPGPSRQVSTPPISGAYAQTTSSITAGGSTSVGFGTVQFYSIDEASHTLTLDGISVEVTNLIPVIIPSGSNVILLWVDNTWAIVLAPCPSTG